MQIRLRSALILSAFIVAACGGGTNDDRATPAPPANNDDGTPVTAVLTANFDPTTGTVPLPNNLLFLGTGDLTLNLPIADPTDPASGPLLALNALDGWSTVAPWATGFSSPIDQATVIPGSSVRFFEVTLNQPGGAVTGVTSELLPGVDFVATVTTSNPLSPSVAIVPLKPLRELTTYMAVITDGVADPQGNQATPSQAYFIAKRTTPLINASGQSTDPLLPDATAQALEPLRQLTNAQEAAAASQGINPDDIVISWTATTQSITAVLNAVRSTVQPQFSQFAPTGLNTTAIGAQGAADIFIGVMNMPYYLDAATVSNPLGPVTGNWEAAPGAYVPPFDSLGLDPTSTNVTFLNPFPVMKSLETIPVLVTLPNPATGITRPASGWPVVMFQHGITRNRTDMLALADALSLAGFAVVSIDQPLHGIASTVDTSTGTILGPELNPFYIENTPFGAIASERTFDSDFTSNLTGAPGPDGFIDSSGANFTNLSSLLTGRDNNRQAQADLSVVAVTIPTMDIDGDGLPDFDGSSIRYVSQSLGSIQGIPFLAVEPTVNVGTLSVPGGGVVGLLLGSVSFAPVIIGGLAAAGIEQGTPAFDSFVFAAQTVQDSADPINWGAITAATNAVVVQEVIGSDSSLPDQVVPNNVPGFPLSGTDPLVAVMGLSPISATTQDPMGIRGVTRYVVGSHGSILDPSASLEATIQMQTEAATMSASGGTLLQVAFPEVLEGN